MKKSAEMFSKTRAKIGNLTKQIKKDKRETETPQSHSSHTYGATGEFRLQKEITPSSRPRTGGDMRRARAAETRERWFHPVLVDKDCRKNTCGKRDKTESECHVTYVSH